MWKRLNSEMGLKRQIKLPEVIKNHQKKKKKCRNDWSQSTKIWTKFILLPDDVTNIVLDEWQKV